MKLPWWIGSDQLRLSIIDSGEECQGYYEPTIGTWLQRVRHRDGTIEVYHGPIGREWKVATIRPKKFV